MLDPQVPVVTDPAEDSKLRTRSGLRPLRPKTSTTGLGATKARWKWNRPREFGQRHALRSLYILARMLRTVVSSWPTSLDLSVPGVLRLIYVCFIFRAVFPRRFETMLFLNLGDLVEDGKPMGLRSSFYFSLRCITFFLSLDSYFLFFQTLLLVISIPAYRF